MTEPPAAQGDDKDWTWVLERTCPQCGFDAQSVGRHEFARMTLAYSDAINVRVDLPGSAQRPTPQVWSPVEYACHARDVCRIFATRLDLMLNSVDPLFDNWDQDETARDKQYWTTSAAEAADELDAAAEAMAGRWSTVQDDEWGRPGRRSNGSQFTVESLGRYFLHDLAHHAWDVRGVASAVTR